uniref:Nucleotide-diphospho-sugar transferase domain-containing protein n=1 Tax=uncultured Desulfobacterium sp. TaxID=201089 RepID=E1YIE6_9BACT|nr:hypothetical protein N47_D28020 [uncultured Desulfobacterium sp.]
MIYYFTSITANYLAKARVLGFSLKNYNANAKFVLAISEPLPSEINLEKEPFDFVIESESLNDIGNKNNFFFKHNITELCTAVKPFVAEEIMKRYGAEKVVYLDPDIGVFNPLDMLDRCLDNFSILLTPHQTVPETIDRYIRENEILFLKRGVYNLGFFGVKNNDEGLKFLKWWQSRLLNYCFDDNYQTIKDLQREGLLGMFTDQKWIDLVPAFFDNYHIIKDSGYNVCTWNLSSQHISIGTDGAFFANNTPLYFFHFSGFDSGGHHNEMQRIILNYPNNNQALALTKWYENELEKCGQKYFGEFKAPYAFYSNGEKIQDFERKIYHIRKDIHSRFKNPFIVHEGFCFYNWVRQEYAYYFNPNIPERIKWIDITKKLYRIYFLLIVKED